MTRTLEGEDIMELIPPLEEIPAVVGGDNPTPATGCAMADRTYYDQPGDEGNTTPEMYTDRTIFKRPYLSEYYELEAQIEVFFSPSSMLPVIRTVWNNFD